MMKTSRAIFIFGFWCFTSINMAQANDIYLVRHAEKLSAKDTGSDPQLTACGQQRARYLADYFATIPLQAIYSTDYQRTKQTASPTANSKHLAIQLYDPRQLTALAETLRDNDYPVLVVGHSNTTPQLVALLQNPTASTAAISNIDEQDFAQIYQVTIGETGISVKHSSQRFVCQQ